MGPIVREWDWGENTQQDGLPVQAIMLISTQAAPLQQQFQKVPQLIHPPTEFIWSSCKFQSPVFNKSIQFVQRVKRRQSGESVVEEKGLPSANEPLGREDHPGIRENSCSLGFH